MTRTFSDRPEPGGVKINSAILINKDGLGLDIRDIIVELNLYESILSPFITGNISLSDSAAINEIFPLIGEESLILDIETPLEGTQLNLRRKSWFMVYKMTNKENVAIKQVFYTLHFISIEGFTDANVKISQTYKGKISDIVQKIVKGKPGLGSSKDIIVEETSNNEIYTSNFWTPVQNIYYLTEKAINKRGNPSYVFFENNEGFVFASLEGLLKAGIYQNFINHSKTRGVNEPQSLEEEYTKVLDISTPVHYDYFDRLQAGFYGGSIYHYDLVSKRLVFLNRVAKKHWGNKQAHLNKHLAISNNLQFTPDAFRLIHIEHSKLYPQKPELPEDHYLKRAALLSWFEAQKINIRVFGRFDYTAGRIVNLTSYTNTFIDEKTTDDKIIDKAISGNYLISAIAHEITSTGHFCNLELIKDSLLFKD